MIERSNFYTPDTNYFSVEEFASRELAREINYFKTNWHREGLPYNWRDLPGTGFIVSSQMELLRHGDKEIWLSQTKEDIKGFVVEYLAQGLTFPIFYDIQEVDGRERVVAPLYGNKLMVDTVSDEERNGVVRTTLSEKIEPFLLGGSDGSIAVMTSTSGPSGLTGSNGREIIYPDSQTYILQRKGKEIVGFTIRTDFDKREHARFIKSLGGEVSEEASDEDFVRSVVLLTPDENKQDVSDIVFAMQRSRKESSGNIFAYKNRLWEEVYLDLLRREELWSFDARTDRIFQQFRDYVSFQELDEEATKEALATTILRIARLLRPGEKVAESRHISTGYILQEVQKLPGCAGGGGSSGLSLVDSFAPRFGISAEEAKNDPNLCRCNDQSPHFHCPGKNTEGNLCNKEISVGQGIASCPSCGEGKKC